VPRSYKYGAAPSSNPLGKKMMAYVIAAEKLMGNEEFIAKMKQAIMLRICCYGLLLQLL
jgi:hypothetical protein